MEKRLFSLLLALIALVACPFQLFANEKSYKSINSETTEQLKQNKQFFDSIKNRMSQRMRHASKTIDIYSLQSSLQQSKSGNINKLLKSKTEQEKVVEDQKFAAEIADILNRQLNISGLELRLRTINTDDINNKHITYDQYAYGKRVINASLIAHADKELNIKRISGNYDPEISVTDAATISVEEAITIALKDLGKTVGANPYDSVLICPAELVFFAGELSYYLIPKIHIGNQAYYIEAHTGKILFREPLLKFHDIVNPSSNGTNALQQGNRLIKEDGTVVQVQGWQPTGGNFYLFSFDKHWGVVNHGGVEADDEPVGSWYSQTTSDWGTSNRPVISLAKNIDLVQNYSLSVLNRNSYDGNGTKLQVHYPVTFDSSPNNACWDESNKILDFGAGDGATYYPFTSLDIVAHEFGHAITSSTSNLEYAYESGALNEAYSDIFGTLVEFWAQPDGTANYPNFTAGKADWLHGEDCYNNVRDLRDPSRSGYPTRYYGTNWITSSADYGGVHTNLTVASYAFYLLSQGVSTQFTNDGLVVLPFTGLGINNAGIIAMNANMYYNDGNRFADMIDTRGYWQEVAAIRGLDISAVARAWSAVGVGTFTEVSNTTISSTINYDDLFIQFGKNGTATNLTSTANVTSHGTEAIVIKPNFAVANGAYFHAYLN